MLQEPVFYGKKLVNLSFDESESHKLITKIEAKIKQLSQHPVYNELTSRTKIKCFILYHIFAVWDFVKLLKPLQKQFLAYPRKSKRFIDQMIFAQTSDLYSYDQQNEDFALYLRAIAEMEIDPDLFLWYFQEAPNNLDLLKPGIKKLVEFNLAIAKSGLLAEITAVFFYGREKLNSRLFASAIKILKQEKKECSILTGYSARLLQENNFQFELLSLELLNYICQDEAELVRALQAGLEALDLKEQLWNEALAEMLEINN